MKNTLLIILGLAISFCFGYFVNTIFTKQPESRIEINQPIDTNMKLGAFSMSLSVKDLKVSKQFYENLGFVVFGGSLERNYLIMKNGNALVGIFQGMFEGNMLTFNPGWDENAKNIEKFNDVREIQKHLKNKNIPLTMEADEKTSGPAYIMLTDPDGNGILIDQHR